MDEVTESRGRRRLAARHSDDVTPVASPRLIEEASASQRRTCAYGQSPGRRSGSWPTPWRRRREGDDGDHDDRWAADGTLAARDRRVQPPAT